MNEDEIRDKLDELNIDPSLTNDIMAKVNQRKSAQVIQANQKQAQEFELKSQLDAETDWQKRAAIAARIISINLE